MASGDVQMQSLEERGTRFQVNRVKGKDGNKEADQAELEPLQTEDEEYVASYSKSFRHFTREALPRIDNYRNIMSIQAAARPTLEELHNETEYGKIAAVIRMDRTNRVNDNRLETEDGIKFGWVKGVLIRNILNIWGVMLFLRLSWVIGQAGIVQGVMIILGSSVVTLLTAMSMSAISTNGLIRGGGSYFMISRSLGPEFGASIGLIFSLANALACAMYTVGFCESLLSLLNEHQISLVDGGVQDIRIFGSITILILLTIVVVGMEWEAKAQIGLLVILVAAILDFFIGALIGPQNDESKAKGFVGFSIEVFKNNFGSDYRYEKGVKQDFFSVFSVFFPAASGFLAGANISGDLKDPQKAIPKGTILAIFITSGSYLLMGILAGSMIVRDASGNVADFYNGTFTNCMNKTCAFGLQNNFQVMGLVAAVGPVIYAGCFAATLSSALASLVSAPKVFQALCKDNLYPYLSPFGKGYGSTGEPVRGYVLTFFIALAFILVGDLNAIAPLISNFFLAAYALINFSTFHASFAKPVGWRPTFKYYNMWLSLLGAIICIVIMFLISWWTALVTLCCVLALYLIVNYRKPDVNWGSSTQAQTYKNALMSVHQLNRVDDHVKNYCPQILVLSGAPNIRPTLIDFAYLISKNISLLICGNISEKPLSQKIRNAFAFKAQNWLYHHKIKAFFANVDDITFDLGAQSLMQSSGLGKLRPNILMMGYKSNWQTCKKNELEVYFNVIHKALDLYLSMAILRLQEGLDYSHVLQESEITNVTLESNVLTEPRQNFEEKFPGNMSSFELSKASSTSDLSAPVTPTTHRSHINKNPNVETVTTIANANSTPEQEKEYHFSRVDVYRYAGALELPKGVLNNLIQFQRKQKRGIIDVWWIYDDGGLTLLLPYIISTRRTWADCKLRVFTLANKKDDLMYEQRSMASLLSKFRIDYSDLKVIPDITKKPLDKTRLYFKSLISSICGNDGGDGAITESELEAMKDKTDRHLRLRELLLEYSVNSNLIVMTLPMPRKNIATASLYMAWLEVLTKDMPPFLLARGNQQSVLTFYS